MALKAKVYTPILLQSSESSILTECHIYRVVVCILQHYPQAATWLLTGTIHFDRSANSRIMPSWMPVSAKLKAAALTDAFLHVVSNGDQYFIQTSTESK